MPPGIEWMKMLGIKVRQPRHRPVQCETALEPGVWGAKAGSDIVGVQMFQQSVERQTWRVLPVGAQRKGGEPTRHRKKDSLCEVESSDTVVCGFVAKRGCLGLGRISRYILERKIPESERNQDLLLFKALSPESK